MITLPVEGEIKMDELLDLKQAADLLGISEKSLLRLLAREEVPGCRKIVGKWRFSKEALFRWIASGNSQMYTKNSDAGDEDDD